MTSDLPADSTLDETEQRVHRALDGCPEAQVWLFQTFSPYLLMAARRRHLPAHAQLKDPDDMVQETWLHALPRLGTVRAQNGASYERSLLRYLTTILVNLYNDLGRRALSPAAGPRLRLGDGEEGPGASLAAETSGVVTKTSRGEHAMRLHEALERLEPLDRDVVVLRAIEQQSVTVTASVLGIQPATVVNRLRRSLPKLRDLLPSSLAEGLLDA